MKALIILGFVLLITGLYLAFIQHSIIWYSAFIIGGFLLFEGVNKKWGFSVLAHPRNFLLVWLIFIAITICTESVGNYWLNLWNFPSFDIFDYIIHVILVGYAFTGFFGLTFFVFLQHYLHSKVQKIVWLPVTAFLFGYLNEYPNRFAHEWVYINWPLGKFFDIPILVSVLWVALLVVLVFKRFFLQNNLPGVDNIQKQF